MSLPRYIRTTNIKLSVAASVNREQLVLFSTCANVTKRHPSFFVYRVHVFVYIIYYSGHINITGIACKKEIHTAIHIAKSIYGVVKLRQCKVDNITSCGDIGVTLHRFFSLIQNEAESLSNFPIVRFCQESFPGAQFKQPGMGTVMLFRSGKFNIVGCKSFSTIVKLANRIDKVVHNATC